MSDRGRTIKVRLIQCFAAVAAGAALAYPVACLAQHRHQAQPADETRGRVLHIMEGLGTEHHKELMTANTVSIVSGNGDGTDLYLALDMAAVLDSGKDLRVLPLVGKGAYQNMMDVLHLRGVDLGITHSNIMRHLKRTGVFGAAIDRRIVYVTMLHKEEMHILAGPGIKSVLDLRGRKVNFGAVGSGTQFSTQLIFKLLGIGAHEINVSQARAYRLVKSGAIAATVLIAGTPAASFKTFKLEPGMRLLPIGYADVLRDDYYPAKLTDQDYPNLISPGGVVDTIGVSSVLVTYNWPRKTDRYRRVARFIDAFFSKFSEFQGPAGHPKWREVDLSARLPGWGRFPAAEEWLERNPPLKGITINTAQARAQAARAAPGDPAEQARLLRDFLEWSKRRGATTPSR